MSYPTIKTPQGKKKKKNLPTMAIIWHKKLSIQFWGTHLSIVTLKKK
jgi:hypothetical protein